MNQNFSFEYDDIENKLYKLQKDMEEIWILLREMNSDLLKKYGKSYLKKPVKPKPKTIILDDRAKWKKEINSQIKILVNMNAVFKRRSEVLHYIYNYMRRNYGIAWEQDIKEYKERFNLDYKPKTIDVVFDNKTYRSIFEAILVDLIANSKNR